MLPQILLLIGTFFFPAHLKIRTFVSFLSLLLPIYLFFLVLEHHQLRVLAFTAFHALSPVSQFLRKPVASFPVKLPVLGTQLAASIGWRKSHETLQRAVRLFPSHQQKVLKVPHPTPQLFPHCWVFNIDVVLPATGEKEGY